MEIKLSRNQCKQEILQKNVADIPRKLVNKTCTKERKKDSKIPILRHVQYTVKAFDNFRNKQQTFFEM